MNNSTIDRKDDKTIKLNITVPDSTVSKARDEVLEELIKNADLKGFRKGKAPRDVVEKAVGDAKINDEVLRKVVPQAYLDALKEHKINPIIQPKIQIMKFAKGNDLVFNAETCEAPTVKLGDYKKQVKDVTAKSKIIIPGQEKQEPNMDEILSKVISSTKLEIPAILVQQETDRMLSQTLDEIKKLGLTLDQYLASTGKKVEDLRADYEKKAINDLSLEFILQDIADTEKIEVTEADIDTAIAEIKDPQERENIQKNKYIFATILRKQKALDFLKSL